MCLSLLLSLSLSGRLSPLSLSQRAAALSSLFSLSGLLCLVAEGYCIGDSNYFRLTFWLLSPILMVTLLKKRQ